MSEQRSTSTGGERRENFAGWLWISPWVFGFAAFLLVPIVMSLYYSMTDYPLLEKPVWIGLDNYTRMVRDPVFVDALLRTALFAVIAIPLCTGLSLLLAALIESKSRARDTSRGGGRWGAGGAAFAQACIFVPTLVPMTATAMIWLWLLNGQSGLINRALRGIGLPAPNWLTDSSFAMPSLTLITLWGVGQAVITYIAALRQVPTHLYEAADLDGMGPLRRFFNVTAPMISPVILFNVITLTIGTLQLFTIPYVLTKATPGGDPRALYFYTSYLYDNGFVYAQMGYASAMAWVQLVLTLVLTGATFLVSRNAVYVRGA